MNQAARRFGRTLALVLPVVLVLSGTLAVANVPWSGATDTTVLPAGAGEYGLPAAEAASKEARAAEAAPEAEAVDAAPAPEEALLELLLDELRRTDPGAALTTLQWEVERNPALAEHCPSLARELGRAAVVKYGSAELAHRHARPVCDTSFAIGVTEER
ncbi:hypothetical protein FNQ90_11005 [Streptomyces alkaliphilus]|uniref:Uncharacterized protein n=1 Tax=Streptomyces alkaliphilus TaxID=1472722 RepID=A0A7W3Y1S9_9ACTN|nr:hypothetical protein [Streptomyces alkaliphilus]MBB0244617.1 hypothetical protein [Streptomyces alkaliphilus]